MFKFKKARYALVAALAFSFLSVPVASQAILPAVTVTVSTTHPNYNEQVTLSASGLTPGNAYKFGYYLPGYEYNVPMSGSVVANGTGTVKETVTWSSDFTCPPPIGNSYICSLLNSLVASGRGQISVVNANADEYAAPLGTSDNVYPGRDNKLGNITLSGAGYKDGKFVAGETLHISANNVGGSVDGNLLIQVYHSSGTTVDDFWNAVEDGARNNPIGVAVITAGATETDITVPSFEDLPEGPLQVNFAWYRFDSSEAITASGNYQVVESAAGQIGTPPVINNYINSITQVKAWANVDFTLPALTTGKYDRVAYSVDGGSWTSWGLNAKSVQSIKGLPTGREYSIRIRGHVKRGAWTAPSEAVKINMKKIRKGVVVP